MPNDAIENGSTELTRRSLLKGVGASAVAGIALTGTAGAKPITEMNRVEAAYDDSARARWAVAEHADPVLAELAVNGVLDRGDVAELDFADLSVAALAKDGTATAQLETTTDVDGGKVEVVVRPETGRAYATVRANGDVYTIESAAGSDDVTTEGECWYEHKCESVACSSGGGCLYLERECCCQDGTTGLSSDDVSTTCDQSCTNWYEDGCCTC